jgi:CS domain
LSLWQLVSALLTIARSRHDFYQTPTTVIASYYLKKIDKAKSKVVFSSPTTLDLDLLTSDNKRFASSIPLYAPIDTKASEFKIMGTKLELTMAKADGTGWPMLRSDGRSTGEIIQTGRAGRA